MKKLAFMKLKANGLINAFTWNVYEKHLRHSEKSELVGVAETPEQHKELWDMRERNNRAIKEKLNERR